MDLKEKFETELILIKDEITTILSNTLKNGKALGKSIPIPEKTDSGWRTSTDGLVKIYYNWLSIIEGAFGRNLEQLKSKNKLLELLKEFFETPDSSPPRLSTGDDYTHELKIFLSEVLAQSSIKNSTVLFEDFSLIIEKAFEFFTRNEDEYIVEIPIIGLEIDQPIQLNYGELYSLNWDEKVDLYFERITSGLTANIFSPLPPQDPTNATTMFKIQYTKTRKSNKALGFPSELKYLEMNFFKLLLIYEHGSVKSTSSYYFLNGFSKKNVGVMHSGNASFTDAGFPYKIKDPDSFKTFINKNLDAKYDPLGNHALKLVLNRVDEAWNRSRSNEFRVFDYVSILEALLVGTNEGEFKFRTSILTACLASPKFGPKEELYKLVKKAYDIRSKVAHCAKVKEKDLPSQDELVTLFKLTHFIVREAFEHGREAINKRANEILLQESP
jgi:hypothetical protein